MIRVAAYLRVSTVNQSGEERFGYLRQIAAIETYVRERDLELGETFKDAITGRSSTRTGLTKLKEAAGKYDAVVISSVDRLARDVGTSYKVLAELLELGLEIHSADFGPVDLADESSLVQFNLRSLFAHLERNGIAKRTRSAHLAMAEKGLLPTGIKTYGFQNDNGRAIHDLTQAAIVRCIFEMSAAGMTLWAIQDVLNSEGVSVPRPQQSRREGTPLWHRTTVSKILVNPAYKGEYRWGKYPLKVPPIVSPELWQRAQKGKRGAYPRSGWPLVGHLRCGVCGRRMQSKIDRKQRSWGIKNYEIYRCQSGSLPSGRCGALSIQRDWLEAEAEKMVRQAFSDPQTIRQLLIDHTPPDTTLSDELERLNIEDARWLEAFRLGAISPAELGEYRRDLDERKRALRESQPEPDYAVEKYVEAARELPFAELLEAANIMVIAVRGELRLSIE